MRRYAELAGDGHTIAMLEMEDGEQEDDGEDSSDDDDDSLPDLADDAGEGAHDSRPGH